jgi:hypothetical protein
MSLGPTNASETRARLNFEPAVLKSFSFLSTFGLHPVKQNPTFVRYESREVFVNVYHGRSSYELGIEVGRRGDPALPVSHTEMVYAAGAADAEGFGRHVMFQVGTPEGVAEFVPKLAKLLERYGSSLLSAQEDAFGKIQERRPQIAAQYEKEVRLSNVRAKAEAAWHAKNYAKVVEQFSPVQSDLTEVEALRLSYAQKHLSVIDRLLLLPRMMRRK